MPDAPSSQLVHLQPRELSPAVRGLLQSFVSRGARCLVVGQGNHAMRSWLHSHGCQPGGSGPGLAGGTGGTRWRRVQERRRLVVMPMLATSTATPENRPAHSARSVGGWAPKTR